MKKQKNSGITLVALVLTIIILLILAGISISALTNTGIFQKAKEAKQASENAEKKQNKLLDNYEKDLDQYLPSFTGKTVEEAIQHGRILNATNNTELHDAYGNKIIIPAGFKVTTDATTVDKGIVIEDATTNATTGSQFVWVPVGTIYTDIDKTESKAKTIILGRYDFDTSTGIERIYSGKFVEEDNGDTTTTLKNWGNAIAKNLTAFKTSVLSNGGYYIGRYEAGVTGYNKNNITTNNSNKEKNWTGYINADGQQLHLVCKANQQIWNYITQNKASELSQSMYTNNKYTSDLMNSYAWDTAITFIQKCTDKTNYANQNIGERPSLLYTGKTNDNPCNIFDMASNVSEWTTETTNNSNGPCTGRIGFYGNSDSYTCYRDRAAIYDCYEIIGFRPLIYINI